MALFSTTVHGVLDYLSVGTMLVLPRIRRWDGKVTRFLDGAAAGTFAYSALTRYELGILKVLPMKAHFGLDAALGLLFCAAALRRDGGEAEPKAFLLGMGLFSLFASQTTETE